MASRRRKIAGTAVSVVVGFVLLLAAEVVMTMRREYFETPGYEVEGLLEPSPDDPDDRPPLRLVMLGDSTVAGLGAQEVEDSLPFQTGQRVADALDRDVRVKGLGVSGALTDDVLNEQIPMIDPAADIVVIVIGSNDVTHLTPPWRMDDLTAEMLRAARERAPDALIVLGGIPLFGEARAFNEPLRSIVDAYAGVLRNVQQRTAVAIDDAIFVNIAKEASPRFVGVPEAMSRDQFHPGPRGYGFWADALAAGITAAITTS